MRSSRRRNPWRRFLIFAIAIFIGFCFSQVLNDGRTRVSDRYSVKKVVIDMARGFRVKPAVTSGFPGGSASFEAMVSELKPYAAINGTYYDENNRPLGDIVIDGKVINRGSQRHAVAITTSGEVRFVEKPKGRKFNWKGYKAALACGPRLVHKGRVSVNPEADGFSSAARRKAAWRSAVGVTRDRKLLMAVVENSITLDEMALIMLENGAVEAMNLDGGGACALYHDGKILSRPALGMTNLLVVYKK